jgi:hypothetical protein
MCRCNSRARGSTSVFLVKCRCRAEVTRTLSRISGSFEALDALIPRSWFVADRKVRIFGWDRASVCSDSCYASESSDSCLCSRIHLRQFPDKCSRPTARFNRNCAGAKQVQIDRFQFLPPATLYMRPSRRRASRKVFTKGLWITRSSPLSPIFSESQLSASPASASWNSLRTAFEIWQCLHGREASRCRRYYSGKPTHRISTLLRIHPG